MEAMVLNRIAPRDDTIETPLHVRSFRELALDEMGMSLEEHVKASPYDTSDYLEFGRSGSEEI